MRPAVTSNCSAQAASDTHSNTKSASSRDADGLFFGAAVRHAAAGHRDPLCVPFLEYRFGVVALARDLGQAHASDVRWGKTQRERTTAALAAEHSAWASCACKIGCMSGKENSEAQLRRVHARARARAAAAHRHTGSSHECLCDIDVFFGRRFEERPSVFIGQRFPSFIRDSPLLNQITLVPNENNVSATRRRAMLFNKTFPVMDITKG